MILTTSWIEQTPIQFAMQALADDDPATEKLHEVFGGAHILRR